MSSRRGLGIALGSMLALVSASTPVAADVGPEVIAGYMDRPVAISPAGANVATMSIKSGNWAVIVKASVELAGDVEVTCRLKVGADFDLVTLSGSAGVRPLSLAVVHSLETIGSVILHCQRGTNGTAAISFIKFTAIRVGNLFNSSLPGGSPDTFPDPGGPDARAGYRDGPVAIPSASPGTIGALPLPAGRWWVFAKLTSDDTSASAPSSVSCRLEIGNASSGYASDDGLDELAAGDGSVLALEQTRRLTAAGQARVRCQASTATKARFLKIIAIKVGTLVSGSLGGTFTRSGNGLTLVYSGSNAGPVSVPKSPTSTSMGSLTLPAGPWAVVATAYVRNESGNQTGYLTCKLGAGADFDLVAGQGLTAVAPHRRSPVVMSMVHVFGSTGGAVRLRCRASSAPLKLYSIRIIAVRAAILTNLPLVPPE